MAYVHIEDANGSVIVDTSPFHYAQRTSITVTLDPAVRPMPWKVLVYGVHGPTFKLLSGEELFLARKAEWLDAVMALVGSPPFIH